MTIAAKIYPLELAAGESFTLPVVGDYFKILSAAGPAEVRGDTFGTLGELQAGQGLDRTRFQALTFRDTSGATNALRIVVAGENFVDDRVTGEVSVIDGGKSRTLAGTVFGGNFRVAPVAAQFSLAQWLNPTGSGKRVIVSSYGAITSTLGAYVGMTNVVLATLHASQPANKLSGGAAGVTQQRYTNAAAYGAFNVISQIPSGAFITDPEPIVLLPGYAFVLYGYVVNEQLIGSCHFVEESL